MPRTLYEDDNEGAELKKVGKTRLAEAAERERDGEEEENSWLGQILLLHTSPTTPAGKQTASLFDLWSSSPTGCPLLPLKEAAESLVTTIIVTISENVSILQLCTGAADFVLCSFVGLASPNSFLIQRLTAGPNASAPDEL